MRRGFTLIELLVVIAIIAILAAILFPVFARAKAKARQASCQSNEKQIALAILMYVQDYDSKYPHNWTGRCSSGPTYYDWMEVVQPYVKNWQVFICPSVSLPGPKSPEGLYIRSCAVNLGRSHTGRRGGYALNCGRPGVIGQIGPGPGGNSNHRDVSEEDIRYPAETLMILESRFWCAMYCGVGHAGADSGSTTGWDARRTDHNGGMNVAYCDGHVKWHGRQFRREEFGRW